MATLDEELNDLVTIPRYEYEALLEDSLWLECLDAIGVDRWEGYAFARELFHERLEEEREDGS